MFGGGEEMCMLFALKNHFQNQNQSFIIYYNKPFQENVALNFTIFLLLLVSPTLYAVLSFPGLIM